MKNNEATLFVFIASIIIGILISLNINFNRTYNRVFLTTKQYQDAYNQRNRLRSDISNLQEHFDELFEKMQKFEYGSEDDDKVINEINSELKNNKMILGQMDVEGEGISITLNDAGNALFDNYDDPNLLDKLVHNYDITYVINDLRNAGSEAISVNGQRVIDRSEVICDGTLLRINGVKIASPFYLSAIGNKQVLKNYMLADDNYLKYMISRGIYVDIKEKDVVTIQGYSNAVNNNFVKAVKDK
jgi:uncharacterized protein YlxW (UPF0749 family)